MAGAGARDCHVRTSPARVRVRPSAGEAGPSPAPPVAGRVANHTRVGHFEGYLAVESRDEVALMEAVWQYGPIAVSVYAGWLCALSAHACMAGM